MSARRHGHLACAGLFAMAAAAAPLVAQGSSTLEVIAVRGGVHMIAGPNGNTTVQVGADGVLIVDPQPAALTAGLLAEIRKLSNKPVRYVVNTSGDPEHVGGNQAAAASGQLLQGGNTRAATVYSTGGAPIWAHEGVLKRLSTESPEGAAGWPTDTFFVDQKDLFVNGEPVQLMAAPAAHAEGDVLVVFRRTRRGQRRRRLHARSLSGDRREARRQHQRAGERAQPAAADHGARVQPAGRHAGGARARPLVGRGRRGRLPRHGDHRPRPRPRHGEEGDDARAGEGGEADARLRRASTAPTRARCSSSRSTAA